MAPADDIEPTLPKGSADPLFDGRYRKRALLGRGGFGEVHLVEDTLRRDQRLALKTILPSHAQDDEFAARFHREIDVLRALQHPGIPQIVNDGRTPDGVFYFTLEYVEGLPLGAVVESDGPLAPLRLARLVRQLAAILDYAHGRGVVHRDLKPGNVLVSGVGTPEERVHVLDFGIAKLLENDEGIEVTQRTAGFIGTPEYASPEQVLGDAVDARSDAYALGILIHFLATGRTPFEGKSRQEVATKRLHTPPTPLSKEDAPREIRALVRSLLERERDRRPDPTAISATLDRLLGELGAERARSRRTGLWAAAATAVAAGLGVWALARRGTSAPPLEPTAAVERAESESGPRAVPADSSAGRSVDPETESAAAQEQRTRSVDTEAAPSAEHGDSGAEPPSPDPNASEPIAPNGDPVDAAPLPDADATDEEPTAAEKGPDSTSGDEAAVAPAVLVLTPLAIDLLAPGPTCEVGPGEETVRIVAALAGGAPGTEPRVTIDGRPASFEDGAFALDVAVETGTHPIAIEVLVAGQPAARETVVVTRRAPLLPAGAEADPSAGFAGDLPRVLLLGPERIPLVLVERSDGPPVYLGRTEVTRGEFGADGEARLPMVDVSLEDARAFAASLGARLPTQDEWLAGALGDTDGPFPWGAAAEPARAHTRDAGASAPVAVDDPRYAAGQSPSGLLHMAGNAAEWALESDLPVLLGGSYRSPLDRCRAERRVPAGRNGARPDVGFRLALSPPVR